jgi:hypothetical protein
MMVVVSELDGLRRGEPKRWTEESLIISVRRAMMAQVSEWKDLH